MKLICTALLEMLMSSKTRATGLLDILMAVLTMQISLGVDFGSHFYVKNATIIDVVTVLHGGP